MAHLLAVAHVTAGFRLAAPVGEDRVDRLRHALAVLGVEPDERLHFAAPLELRAGRVLAAPVPPQVLPLAVQHEEDTGYGVDHMGGELAFPA